MKRPGVTVIAEAGVNHNGHVDIALRLIDAAKSAGADIVKFQSFTASGIVLPSSPKADYQRRTTPEEETQFEMLQNLELSQEEQRTLALHATKLGISFLSTPFDRPSLQFLVKDLGLGVIKLPSSDLTNLPLLVEAGRSNVDLILSTGMSTLGEVEMALKALAFGMTQSGMPTDQNAIEEAYLAPAAQDLLTERVVLLHCTSDYPASIRDVNLRGMQTLGAAFSLPVGYSDHTQGITVSLAAVALGAIIIEKHLTLDNSLPGPDHSASSEPDEFASLVAGIREVEAALGSRLKAPTVHEMRNRATMRKGLYAARELYEGTIITDDDIAVVRPELSGGYGSFFEWLGRPAPRHFHPGDPLTWT